MPISVVAWGDNSHFQISNYADIVYDPQEISYMSDAHPSNILCAGSSTVLTVYASHKKKHELFAKGDNSDKLLSYVNETITNGKLKPINRNNYEEYFCNLDIYTTVASDDFFVSISTSGDLITWGRNNEFGFIGRNMPPMDIALPGRVIMNQRANAVSCGRDFVLVLTETGTVFAFGNNAYHQCSSKSIDNITTPEPVTELHTIPVRTITCGWYHSIAKSVNNHVFSWGRNSKCQISHTKCDVFVTPTLLNVEASSVMASGERSGYVLKNGRSCFFGDNKYHQSPVEFAELCSQLFLAPEYTFFLLRNGQLWACGKNSRGQLGLGFKSSHVETPCNVTSLNGTVIKSLSCGSEHVCAIVASKNNIGTTSFNRHSSLAHCQALSIPSESLKRSKSIFADSFGSKFKKIKQSNVFSIYKSGVASKNFVIVDLFDNPSNHDMVNCFLTPSILGALFVTFTGKHASFDSKTCAKFFNEHKLPETVLNAIYDHYINEVFQNQFCYPVCSDSLRFLLPLLLCINFSDKHDIGINAVFARRILSFIYSLSLGLRETFVTLLTREGTDKLYFELLVSKIKSYTEYCLDRSVEVNVIDTSAFLGVWFLNLLYLINNHSSLFKLSDTEINDNQKNLLIPKKSFELKPHAAIDTDFINYLSTGVHSFIHENMSPQYFNEFVYDETLLSTKSSWPQFKSFVNHPHLLSLETKQTMLMFDNFVIRKEEELSSILNEIPSETIHRDQFGRLVISTDSIPHIHFNVDRDDLLESSITEIKRILDDNTKINLPLRISFIGEEKTTDLGGVLKEFFQLFCEELISKAVFIETDGHVLWFKQDYSDYYYIGVILGLGIFNNIDSFGLNFPNFLSRALIDKRISVSSLRDISCPQKFDLFDLYEIHPEIAHSLQKILSYEGDDFNEVFNTICFTSPDGEINLIENGDQINLTIDNRLNYANRLILFYLWESTDIQSFIRGFLKVFSKLSNSLFFHLFNPDELSQVFQGMIHNSILNFLNCNLEFESGQDDPPWSIEHPYIKILMNILNNEFDLNMQLKFLKFVTGSDKLPAGGGLKKIKIKIQKNGVEPTVRLPTSYTCFNIFLLPEYESSEKLKSFLELAVENCNGFGLE